MKKLNEYAERDRLRMPGVFHVLLLLLIGFLISSCSRAPRIKLCNHTEVEIVVRLGDQRVDIKAGATEVLSFPFKDTVEVQIESASGRRDYRLPWPPREYLRSPASVLVHAQLEPDGRIHVLPPGTKLPAAPLPEQPEGFPVKPLPEAP